MNKLNNDVKMLLDKYGDLDALKLCLLFWQQIDGVEMNKETISTKQLLNATSPREILNAKLWVETTRRKRNEED